MSRISELGFYNDKDVITQIEWLKKNIGGNLIESLEVKEITDPESADFGKTDIIIHMENGDTHEASYVSALVKSVETRQEGDDVILTFNLATGDKFETRFTVSVHATAAWDSLEGTPQESVPLTEWMNTKAEKTELTAEETARTNADNTLAQRITDLDEDVADEITRIDGEITQEITARTEADALKEDKSNKVSAFQSTPDNDHYPSEKLVYDNILKRSNPTVQLIPVSGLTVTRLVVQLNNPAVGGLALRFSTSGPISNTPIANVSGLPTTAGLISEMVATNGTHFIVSIENSQIKLTTMGSVSDTNMSIPFYVWG